MLGFVERAADLPFEDFAAGTTYNYLAAGLIDSIRLTSLQAIVRGLDGDADQAADSLYAAARAGRWFSRRHPSFVPYSVWFSSAVTLVLERTRPSQLMLDRLATALEDPDRDDVLRQTFLTMRAGLLRERSADPWFIGPRAAPVFVVNRPWRTHQLNSQLAWYVEVLAAAEAPWPARIDEIVDTSVEYFNLDVPFSPERMRQFVSSLVTSLAVIRSLRTVVAIERYRRSHEEQLPASLTDLVPAQLASIPDDPFTGRPVRYVRAEDGYVVYSLGVNRTDEGGEVGVQLASGSDSGIRIRYVD
jgi:hypothetical protein